MLMRAAHRGVDTQVPRDRALHLGRGLETGEDAVPGAVALPSAEQVADPAPRPVLDGAIPAMDHRCGSGTVCRLSTAAEDRRGPLLAPFGNNGSSTAHCSSGTVPDP